MDEERPSFKAAQHPLTFAAVSESLAVRTTVTAAEHVIRKLYVQCISRSATWSTRAPDFLSGAVFESSINERPMLRSDPKPTAPQARIYRPQNDSSQKQACQQRYQFISHGAYHSASRSNQQPVIRRITFLQLCLNFSVSRRLGVEKFIDELGTSPPSQTHRAIPVA
jgi:hypothetical protein